MRDEPPPPSLSLRGEGGGARAPMIQNPRAAGAHNAVNHSEYAATHMVCRPYWSRMLPRGQKYTMGSRMSGMYRRGSGMVAQLINYA